MISRLNRDRESLRVVQTHLEQYLDSEVRVRNTSNGSTLKRTINPAS
jgi:hypothetical protein